MSKVTVEFSTSEFVFSHGRRPSGRGFWAFEAFGSAPRFYPSSTYSEARKACLAEVRRTCEVFGVSGHVTVNVCP